MSDAALFASLERLAIHERRNLPKILGHLAELSGRAASPPGYPSLFAYCLGRLHWSEGETAKRIHAARTASRFPEIYLRIWKGQLSISAVCLLAPHLTNENRGELIKRALRLSKRELETFVATLSPQAERSEKIRTLGPRPLPPPKPCPDLFSSPAGSASQPPPSESHPEIEGANSPPPVRVEFTFTVDESLAKEIEDARALLRNKYPFCRLEDLFREAVSSLLDRLDPARRPTPKERPAARKPGRRRIPPAVRAFVWKRDKGRCAYVAPDGARCRSRAFLEFDHVRPWALGGPSDDARNLRLLCRSHNMQSARRVFGFI